MNSSYNFVPGVMGLILMLICDMGLTSVVKDLILNISEGFGNFIDCGAARLDELTLSIKVNSVNGTRASIGLQYLNA